MVSLSRYTFCLIFYTVIFLLAYAFLNHLAHWQLCKLNTLGKENVFDLAVDDKFTFSLDLLLPMDRVIM